MSSFIRLDRFRETNNLTQQEVADYLGTSKGYISLVERGSSKLSKSNIDKLLNSDNMMGWDTSELIPAFTRIKRLQKYIISYQKQMGKPIDPEDEKLSEYSVQQIKYGNSGVSDNLAAFVTYHWPEIRLEWLIDGSGPMIEAPKEEPKENLEELLIRLIETEEAGFRAMGNKIDSLIEKIDELQNKMNKS